MPRLLISLIMLVAVSAQAQSTFSYRLYKINPPELTPPIVVGGSLPANRPVYSRRSGARLTVTTRDSAGGTIWEMVIDTTYGDMVDTSKLASTLPPTFSRNGIRPLPPKRYLIYKKGNELTAQDFTRTPAVAFTLALPDDPLTSLLLLATGYGARVPKAGFPVAVGALVEESMPRPKPNGAADELLDLTKVAWRRTAPNTLTLALDRRGPIATGSEGTLLESARVTLQFDDQKRIQSIEATDAAAANQPGGASRISEKISLIRIP